VSNSNPNQTKLWKSCEGEKNAKPLTCADGSPRPKSHQSVPAVCIGSDLKKFPLTNRLSLHQKVKIHQKEIVRAFSGANTLRTYFALEEFQCTWYLIRPPKSFHRRGFNTSATSAVSGLLMYNNLIRVVKGRDQGWRKGVKRMRNRSPLLSEGTTWSWKPEFPTAQWMAQETKRHDTTQSFESWRSDESVVSLLYHCCSCFALCGSWFFEVYLGVFQSTETVLINWSKRATRHVQLAEHHEGKAIILKDPVFVHYCSKMQKGESGAKQILRCIQICLARSRRVCSVDRNQSASCLVRILTSDRPISSVAINTKLLEIRCVKAHDEMLLCRLQH